MSEQVPTNQVSLDDLKRAIGVVSDKDPGDYAVVPPAKPPQWWVDKCHEYSVARMEAWRTAFEWREGWTGRFMDKALSHSLTNADMPLVDEGAEGMRLIREHLR